VIVKSICYAADSFPWFVRPSSTLHWRIICEIGAVREIASDSAVLVPQGAPWDCSSSAVSSVQDNEAWHGRTSLPRGEFELGIPVCVFRETIN
jgi:hypothetical protein